MQQENGIPPDWLAAVTAMVVATISGFVSIAQRIVRGHRASLLWVTSEYAAAILAGWLVYDAYPALKPYLPDQVTRFILVAAVAHSAGRAFQGVENVLFRHFQREHRRYNDDDKK